MIQRTVRANECRYWIDRFLLSAVVIFGMLTGCDSEKSQQQKSVKPPPQVSVLKVKNQRTPLTRDFAGEVTALSSVVLYPQVSGELVGQLFKAGQQVNEGDLLFQVDPRALDQAVLDAKANLAQAKAALTNAQQTVARYTPLLPYNAVDAQTYDQAMMSVEQNAAVVEARQSSLDKAELQRSFADIRAPLSGRIGLQQIDVGGYVAAGQTQLTTISNLDQVAANFSISQSDYLNFFRSRQRQQAANQASDAVSPTPRPVQLVFSDSTTYQHAGSMDYVNPVLDASAGTMSMRAVFKNPDHLLRPGMYVRVRVVYEVDPDAVLIPQKAVTQMLGKRFVSVVGANNVVERRPITVGSTIGDQWFVSNGLVAGETIVVEGIQKARPGMTIDPIPYQSGTSS